MLFVADWPSLSTSSREKSGLIPHFDSHAAYHNGTHDVVVLGASARYEPGQFGLHPGPNGEYAIVRYVAPISGEASVKSVFASQDLFETTTDVHVLLNGDSVFDGLVEGVAGSSHMGFARRLSLRQGDAIDLRWALEETDRSSTIAPRLLRQSARYRSRVRCCS